MRTPIFAFMLLLARGLSFAEITAEQSQVPLEVDAPDAAMAKVVLLAGEPSNKPGQHEYFAGCSLLMKALKQTPGVWPVMVANGWPKNEAIFSGAKTIVVFMDAGEKLPWLTPERWAVMQKAMQSGTGLVAMHQAVEVPAAQAAEFKSWLGAVWQKDIGCRGHWDMTLKPATPAHPTLTGVTTFDAPKDGWLYNLHFADTGVTPLLIGQVTDEARRTANAKAHAGRDEVIAWAYERKDGARSVGFTGADLHSSWHIESQRRLVLNAILWTAKHALPTSAGQLDEADFTANLDRKALGVRKKS
jgi:type 1 glutamine amidotransferase